LAIHTYFSMKTLIIKKFLKLQKNLKKKKKKDILTIVVYNTDKNMFGTALSIEITN